MSDCLFCRIANKELDSDVVTETETVLAFRDINPAAPTHVLAIPKHHISSAAELGAGDGELLGHLFEVLVDIARSEGLDRGYRIVTNVGADGGQSVHHLHLHLLGGRALSWPPG